MSRFTFHIFNECLIRFEINRLIYVLLKLAFFLFPVCQRKRTSIVRPISRDHLTSIYLLRAFNLLEFTFHEDVTIYRVK